MTSLDEKTKAELIALCREELGENPDTSLSAKALREMLREKGVGVVTDPNKATPAPEPEVDGAQEDETAKDRQLVSVTLNIPKTEAPMGSDDVFVAVNSRSFLIKRGVNVRVPAMVYEALRNAVTLTYKQQKNGALKEERVHSYPFSVMEYHYSG